MYIYIYIIYISIYPHTRVSSFAGLISVARAKSEKSFKNIYFVKYFAVFTEAS